MRSIAEDHGSVDLVGEDRGAVAFHHICEVQQFLAGEYSTDRVPRIAQDHQCRAIDLGKRRIERLQVILPAAVLILTSCDRDEGMLHQLRMRQERHIGRSRHHGRATGTRDGIQRDPQTHQDIWNQGHVGAGDRPVERPPVPVSASLLGLLHERAGKVAELTLSHGLLECTRNRRGHGEVHLCNPQGDVPRKTGPLAGATRVQLSKRERVDGGWFEARIGRSQRWRSQRCGGQRCGHGIHPRSPGPMVGSRTRPRTWAETATCDPAPPAWLGARPEVRWQGQRR